MLYAELVGCIAMRYVFLVLAYKRSNIKERT